MMDICRGYFQEVLFSTQLESKVCLAAAEMSQDLGRYRYSSLRCEVLEKQNLPVAVIFYSSFQPEGDNCSAVFCKASI